MSTATRTGRSVSTCESTVIVVDTGGIAASVSSGSMTLSRVTGSLPASRTMCRHVPEPSGQGASVTVGTMSGRLR